jgi:hypothetical protein
MNTYIVEYLDGEERSRVIEIKAEQELLALSVFRKQVKKYTKIKSIKVKP